MAIAFVCTRICICFHFSPEHVFDLISFSLALSHCRDVIHPTLLRLISLYNVMYMICYCFETVFRQKNTTKKTQYYPNRKLFRQKESHSTFDCSRCGWCMRAYAFDMENKSTTNLATVSNNSKMTEGKKNTTKHKTQVNVPPTSFMSHGSLHSSIERWKGENEMLEHVQWYGRIVFKHCKSMGATKKTLATGFFVYTVQCVQKAAT